MRRHFLTGTAVLGPLLALTACADADTVESNSNDRSELVTTASVAHSAQYTGNGKASMFGAPREARILFW